MMKAIVCTKYGPPDVLRFQDVEKPAPKEDEVLIKVGAASITYSNLMMLRGEPFFMRLMAGGLRKPKPWIPGSDVAGRIEAVGSRVTQFQTGDEVYGDLSGCGRGAFAEYVCAPKTALALKPVNSSFEEAAAVPEVALVALQGLRDAGQLQKGQKVLIYGASGGIGTFAVQIAKAFGAEVTGVCSTRNLDLVRSLGADRVIDYTKEDFARNGLRYDLILAAAGYRSIFDYKRALSPRGVYVSTGGAMSQIFQATLMGPILSRRGGQKLSSFLVNPNQGLDVMKELIEAGEVKPVIDRCYPLSEVPEAFRYYANGHARGKVVITIPE